MRGQIKCQLVDMSFAKGSAWLVRLDDLNDSLPVYQRGDVDFFVLGRNSPPIQRLIDDRFATRALVAARVGGARQLAACRG
ncbi:MAG TPA: hypothetical protein VNQ97_03590 [Burkholderiaceae bacterium]|nr:hypothetical protein [Burkholderiaceae bacterium]